MRRATSDKALAFPGKLKQVAEPGRHEELLASSKLEVELLRKEVPFHHENAEKGHRHVQD